MQKETDGQIGPQHAQHLRYQLQLVVLYPHGCAVGGGARRGLGKALVDVDVAIPPFAVVERLDDDVVVQRPQCGVGESLVVLSYVRGAQPYRMKFQLVLDDGAVQHVEVGSGPVVVNAGPADPGPAPTPQHRLQGGDQASGAAFPGCAAVGKTLQIDGQSIGYHHEVRVPEGLRIANLRLLASRGSH
ncbi:Uncharacterised protein [Mycobacterium tuberculosis]|nr:Uncharacterised protein [Mycobacterium tuberculosis]SGF75641.1 Uncharacterised protein [Mycobacterium tuberculosis]SGF96558.1 Uncharacterised protein [Mycobacterium tuberculosis]SGH72196.1 Uncharacterised protein [Mycobacterium tuberculosis]SGJ77840.1 Uncharacterised protein [Mycobacterium tuberculosis]